VARRATAAKRCSGLTWSSCRGQRARHTSKDFSRNLGRPVSLRVSGMAERRQRSEARGARESESLVVPRKPGNGPAGPGGGKWAPGQGTVGGKDVWDIEPGKHLDETATDSETGQRTFLDRRVRDGVAFGASCRVANPCHRGAGCGKSARPDLWGAWAGNRPGLPDSALQGAGKLLPYIHRRPHIGRSCSLTQNTSAIRAKWQTGSAGQELPL